MTNLALDSTGDLDFNPSTGVFNTVDEDDELAQKLWLVLGINLGEIEWDDNIGLDHIDMILNGDDQSVLQSILKEYLEQQWPDTFDSIEITDFNADGQQRLTNLSATVTLLDGTTATASVGLDDDDGGDTDASD